MKIFNIFLIVLICFLFVIDAPAEEYEVVEYQDVNGLKIPPAEGMKVIKVGNAYMTVPEDSEVYSMNNVIFVESAKQYSSRRFLELEESINDIDGRLKNLETTLSQLKNTLNKPKTKVLSSQNEE